MKKRLAAMLMTMAIVCSLVCIPAAAVETHTETWPYSYAQPTITNVYKTGTAVPFGTYYEWDDELDDEVERYYGDSTGFKGVVLTNDHTGMRVYYAKGSSHVTGCVYLYAGKLESTGSYPYSNIPYSVYNKDTNDFIEWSCSGTGFAKYSINYDYDNCQTNGDVELGVGVWLFAEPADYQFLVIVEPEETTPAVPTAPAFADVVAGSYYSNPVKWAVEKGITTGTTATTFSPNNTCTRAQIITFLWRAAGSPEPKKAASFTDVAAGTYYAKACAWAAENGMTSGKTFAPNAPCTREMAVEFMWKSAGSPKAPSASFSDVSAPAVDWAVANGVTLGTTATTFAPNNTCTRAQIVTFLHRAFAK